MSIQEKKAKDKGIKLIAEFVNFSNDLDLNSNPVSVQDAEDKNQSQFLISDE